MKINFREDRTQFLIHFLAETMQEAALLSRFGMDHTTVKYSNMFVGDGGTFSSTIVFRKHRKNTGFIQKRK